VVTNDLNTKIALLEKEVQNFDPQLSRKVAVLEKEVSQYSELITKFDTTIDRLSDVSTSLEKLAVVHETRLAQQEKKTEEIVEKMNEEIKKLITMMEDLAKKEDAHYSDLSTRMHAMERWKWMIVGGSVVLVLLTSKLDLSKLFTIFHG
jgi:predicted  nucleic acid-binding Zn-ribbon protein